MSDFKRSHKPMAESWEYRGLYAAIVPLCVGAVVLERLSPWQRVPTQVRESVLSEARAIAHTVVPHALMR